MITRKHIYLFTAISFFVGIGGGYILGQSENLHIDSVIMSILIGLIFSSYGVPLFFSEEIKKLK